MAKEHVFHGMGGDLNSRGSVDATGGYARFNTPLAVATDLDYNVYVADRYNHTIRKIMVSGEVSTIAGRAGESGGLKLEEREGTGV